MVKRESGRFGGPLKGVIESLATAMKADQGNWRPMRPYEVASQLSTLRTPWWVAGGWAMDLHLGAQSRPHDDIDIGVLRRDVGNGLLLVSLTPS